MKARIALLSLFAVILTTACQHKQTVCQPGSTSYLPDASQFPILTSQHREESRQTRVLVEIGGKVVEVDRVVEGPICNESWSGTIYVGCELQVVEWDGKPTFLKNCEFSVEPGSIVYVAAHNDTAYYKGCSCHTGELN